MKLKDAIASLRRKHPEDPLYPLYTPWGEKIRDSGTCRVWQEYPRPQLVRDNFTILNGKWKYAITPPASPCPGQPIQADGEILVPFSPEAPLSGVGRQLQPDEYLWYERELCFSGEELARRAGGMRCILHFDAVDQQACVFCNGRMTASHLGGYLPFTAELTEFVSEQPLLLQVRVRDESDTSWHARGKQVLKRGGMFYTAQSGIWQSVWYEWVPANYIESLHITPNPGLGSVTVKLRSPKEFASVSCTVYRAVCRPGTDAARTNASGNTSRRFSNRAATPGAGHVPGDSPSGCAFPWEHAPALIGAAVRRESHAPDTLELTLPEEDRLLWTPETPYLYGFVIHADEDVIHSYFALRSFTVEADENRTPRFCLNHKPLFLHGLLDQGYWPDGLMTAPCDEAFVYDIELARKTGFNMLRKHLKIEPMRWYYHCDRLGMIVWQDMVSGGTSYHMPLVCYMPTVFPHMTIHTKDRHYRLFSRADKEGRAFWERECLDTVDYLHSVPSIAVWVPFNEGWGQFDALRIAGLVKEKDPSRPVDHASGWFDQRGGDFRSIHNYFRPLKVKHDKKRAFAITEYGGYACHIAGHSSVDRIYGYKKFETPEELNAAYHALVEGRLFSLKEKGLSGAVYTQLSDVEEEVNGLVTYDRRIVKIRPQ